MAHEEKEEQRSRGAEEEQRREFRDRPPDSLHKVADLISSDRDLACDGGKCPLSDQWYEPRYDRHNPSYVFTVPRIPPSLSSTATSTLGLER